MNDPLLAEYDAAVSQDKIDTATCIRLLKLFFEYPSLELSDDDRLDYCLNLVEHWDGGRHGS